ncbi:MAG: Wzz/FepE/Etk N-terminal domain-containing protein, partial [Bacteroidia bacterium]
MNSRPDESSRLNMTDLLVYLYKWRKPLLLVTISGIILSAIFSSSLFIDPKYKAKIVMYPTKTYSISKSVLGEKYSPDILQFGEEVQAEQLMQIINSDAVKNRIISKYDL